MNPRSNKCRFKLEPGPCVKSKQVYDDLIISFALKLFPLINMYKVCIIHYNYKLKTQELNRNEK